MAARYWRISAIRTASNALALSALALSDGSTDYPAGVLTGALTPSFRLDWDLGAPVEITQIKLTAITQPEFPQDFLLEQSADGAAWIGAAAVGTLSYQGDTTAVTLVLGDLNFGSVSLLLHGDTLTDSSPTPKSLTAVGNVAISTAQSKFGGSSLHFDGSGDSLSIADSDSFDFGTGDFTVELWANFTSHTSTSTLISQYVYQIGGWLVQYLSSGAMRFGVGDSPKLDAAWSPANGQWYHIAATRSGSSLKYFIDGAQIGSTANDSTNITGVSTPLIVGALDTSSAQAFNGYIDELRVTKGIARYTANFTPPVAAFTVGASGTIPPAINAINAPSGITHLADGTLPEPGVALISSAITALDQIDGGTGTVTGTVAEKHLPTNTPLMRRVVLIDERSHRVVRETWSDATGAYAFTDIAGTTTYTVLSYDHTGTYRAVIADNLSPT